MMRKALTIAAACGLALGVAACGKHDDANSSANLSASDNMLVPADENSADSAMNDAGMTSDNAAMMDNSTAAMSNDMAGNASNAQ